jgi:hypothetical protein
METQQDLDTLAAAIYRDKVLRARELRFSGGRFDCGLRGGSRGGDRAGS